MNFQPQPTPRTSLRRIGGFRRRRAASAIALAIALSQLLLGATALAAAPDATLDSVLALLAQRQHGHALYTEQVDSPLLKRPLHTSGELFFDAPDRLEKKTLLPAPQDLIVEGNLLTMVRGKHRASMQLSDYPQLSPLLNGIRATLAGDRVTLEKEFQLALTATGSAWSLNLQPLASEAKPLYQHIEIRGVDGSVKGVTLERASGERTNMALSEPTEP
jgi:outer membrane lipoprotein-sorting protein